jgi:hypothetical protein
MAVATDASLKLSEEIARWQVRGSLVQRLGVLVTACALGSLLPGSVAMGQEDRDGAIRVQSQASVVEVEVFASAQPTPKVCQDPPCPPPPPPDKVGRCVLRIDSKPHKEDGFVYVGASVQCIKETGANLVMRKLAMELEVDESGVGGGVSHSEVNNASYLHDDYGIAHYGHCSYYQGFADVQLTWPPGWVGGRSLSVRTADTRIC